MKSCVAVLVLLCSLSEAAWAQGESGGRVNERESHVEAPGTFFSLSDHVWAELRELRGLVVEQRAELKELRDVAVEQRERLRSTEEEAKEQRILLTGLRVELSITKHEIDVMVKENAEMAAKVNAGENQLLKMESEAHLAQLSSIGTRHPASENLPLQEVLTFSNLFLKDTEKKVAFSAGLTNSGDVGPFDSDTTVVYKRVFINMYMSYNPSTGIFKAPTGGIYQFRYSAAYIGTKNQCLQMYKNDQSLVHDCMPGPAGQLMTVSNGFTVELDRGDTVYMRLPADWKLYDTRSHQNMFSGELLFTGY